jgi:hypothetical protein
MSAVPNNVELRREAIRQASQGCIDAHRRGDKSEEARLLAESRRLTEEFLREFPGVDLSREFN